MKLTSPRGHTSLEPELASNAERRPQQPGTSVLAFLTCISSLYQPTTYPLMTQRERERHNTSVPFALCLLTHQSVEGRVWVEGARVIKKNENTSINCMQCFYFFWYKWYIPIQELQDKSCRVSVIPYNC